MNWLRLLVVMVAMVGCPALSTVLHNEDAVKVRAVDLQDTIVDLSAADSSLFTDDLDDDFDGYLPPQVSSFDAFYHRGVFTYQRRDVSGFRTYHSIRAPPSLS